MLTREQERALIVRVQSQDAAAEAELLMAFEPLASGLARSFRATRLGSLGLELDDLLQAGREAIVRAAREFSLLRSNRFSSYAVHRIQAALQATAAAAEPIPRPVNRWRLERKVFAVAGRISAETSAPATMAEVASEIGIPLELAESIFEGQLHVGSLELLPCERTGGNLHSLVTPRPRELLAKAANQARDGMSRAPLPKELADYLGLELDVILGALSDDPEAGMEIRDAAATARSHSRGLAA